MSTESVLCFGRYQFLATQRLLMDGNRKIRMGSRALEILALLLERAGEVVPKSVILQRVWPGLYVEEVALRVHIVALRKILSTDTSVARHIESVWGIGYRFAAPVSAPGETEEPMELTLERLMRLGKRGRTIDPCALATAIRESFGRG